MIIPISQMGNLKRGCLPFSFSLSYFFPMKLQVVGFLVFIELLPFKICLNIKNTHTHTGNSGTEFLFCF